MSEKAGLPVKKSESKEKGPVSSSSKTGFSQSMDINSPVEQVLHLQRTIGNRAVTRLIQSGVLQAKLKTGTPDDIYEQEADRVVEQAMRLTDASLVQRTNGGGGGGGAAPCTPRPVATLHAFNKSNGSNTSPNNCCPDCPLPLGVGPNNMANNRMEMEIEIANHCPGSWYDILRTRENALYEQVQIGGTWQWRRLEHQPMGTWDDIDNNDECLRLQNGRYIYVKDGPGWNSTTLPAPDGTRFDGLTGTSTDANARQVVVKFRFAEWVNFKHKNHGINWTTISSPKFFHWHSTTWLVKMRGQWRLQTNFSKIERGSQAIGTTP